MANSKSLDRYGKANEGMTFPAPTTGYWTPWHIAQNKIDDDAERIEELETGLEIAKQALENLITQHGKDLGSKNEVIFGLQKKECHIGDHLDFVIKERNNLSDENSALKAKLALVDSEVSKDSYSFTEINEMMANLADIFATEPKVLAVLDGVALPEDLEEQPWASMGNEIGAEGVEYLRVLRWQPHADFEIPEHGPVTVIVLAKGES